MPNITITVDDRLYRAARIYAVNRKTTVTEIVREHLLRIVHDTGEYKFAAISEENVRFELRTHPGIFRAKGYETPALSITGTVKNEADSAPPHPTPPPLPSLAQ